MSFYRRKKVCRFCANPDIPLTYKQSDVLAGYITDRGKIIPRRISGICSKHQRLLSKEIKRARTIALLPFTVTGR